MFCLNCVCKYIRPRGKRNLAFRPMIAVAMLTKVYTGQCLSTLFRDQISSQDESTHSEAVFG